jgi:hypothetical protein
MSTTSRKLPIPADARVLGERAFAAISAVEGIVLTADSRHRLATMRRRNLSPEEQRAEIVRAYAGVKSRR